MISDLSPWPQPTSTTLTGGVKKPADFSLGIIFDLNICRRSSRFFWYQIDEARCWYKVE